MATLNLGRIKPVFRGAWTSGAFVIDDIVTHGNESFICIQAGTNKATSDASYWTKLAAKGTDGTDVGTTITTQGDILFRDGSGLQRLAKGTAGQVLKVNSGATAPEWGTAPSGDCVKISTVNAAGAADIYMDNVFTDTYKYYRLVYGNVKFSSHTGGAWLRIGFRTGGASGANHGGTYYQKHQEQYGGEGANTNNAGSYQSDSVGVQIMNTWNLQTDSSNSTYAPYRGSGMLDFFYPTQDNYKPNFLLKVQWQDNGHVGYSQGVGYNNSKITSGGITGLRINCEAHNISSGFFTLYGFKL